MTTTNAVPSATAGIKFRLSVMMFIQYIIGGSWVVLSFQYIPELGFDGVWLALIFGAFNIAAFTAMFFSTQFADRNFAAGEICRVQPLCRGLAILGLFWVHGDKGASRFVSDILFAPAVALCVLRADDLDHEFDRLLANLKDPQHDFGPVRLWGTIGWIAVSWPFVFILADWSKIPAFGSVSFIDWLSAALSTSKTGVALQDARSYIFIAAGISSLVLAVFSLSLPNTPPKPAADAGNQLAWLEAMKLLRNPFLLVLFVVTFIDATIHQVYFNQVPDYLKNKVGIPGQWIMPVMSIGQIAEIGTMAILAMR
ncbi:MAG: MFS transporter [Planctomycetaceae bacterium]